MSENTTEPRGTVQRWDYSATVPKLFHRTRDPALFAESEWNWSEDKSAAHVFETYEEAERHVKELTAEGVQHVHPVVHSASPELLQARQHRQEQRLAQTMRSIAPAECFERLEKEGLA